MTLNYTSPLGATNGTPASSTTNVIAPPTVTIPGGSSDDRKYEVKAIDGNFGHILAFVTYASGKTGFVLSNPSPR